MKNITECNPLEYSCFYYINTKTDVLVYKRKPSGDEILSGVDQFLTQNGSIIAFKYFTKFSTDMAYLAKYEDTEELIQYQVFESMIDLFSGSDSTLDRHYALFSSRSFDSATNTLVLSPEDRCDSQIFASLPFWEINDGSGLPLTDNSSVNKNNLKEVFVPICVPGSASIVRLTFENPTGTYVNFPVVSVTAKTFLGSLRLACEWYECTKEPFNSTEYPALKIAEFVTKLEIDSDIMQTIYSAQEPMAVAKFILEPTSARTPSVENGILPEEVSSWIKGIIRYRTLNSLVRETGITNEIPEDILLLEKSTIASEVFKLCLEANIQFETMSYEEIRNSISHLDKTGIGSSPGECVEKLSGL